MTDDQIEEIVESVFDTLGAAGLEDGYLKYVENLDSIASHPLIQTLLTLWKENIVYSEVILRRFSLMF